MGATSVTGVSGQGAVEGCNCKSYARWLAIVLCSNFCCCHKTPLSYLYKYTILNHENLHYWT